MSSGKDSYLVNFYHGEGDVLRRLSRDTDIPVAVLLRSAVRCFLSGAASGLSCAEVVGSGMGERQCVA